MRTLWLILAVLLSAASPRRAPGVWVDVAASASACRDPLLAAIHEKRPDVEVHAGRAPGTDDVSALVTEKRGALSLVIRAPGEASLRRSLPLPGRDCAATASIAALMLDRYLADVHWSGTPVRIEAPVTLIPLPAAPPAPMSAAPAESGPTVPVSSAAPIATAPSVAPVPAAVLPVAAPSSPVATSPAPRPGSKPVALPDAQTAVRAQAVIEIGGSVAATSLGAWPFFDADLSARLGSWQVGVGGSVTGARQTPVTASDPAAGSYVVETGSVRLVAGYRFQLGPGALRLEVAPGAELLAVRVSGSELFHLQPGLAGSPYVALRVAYEIALPWRLALALRAEGRANLWPAAFNVQGDSGGVSTLPWGGNLALAVSRVFF